MGQPPPPQGNLPKNGILYIISQNKKLCIGEAYFQKIRKNSNQGIEEDKDYLFYLKKSTSEEDEEWPYGHLKQEEQGYVRGRSFTFFRIKKEKHCNKIGSRLISSFPLAR